jgi:hypothetical protein
MGTHLLSSGYHGKKKTKKRHHVLHRAMARPLGFTLHLIHGQLAKAYMDILSMIQFAPKVIANNNNNNNNNNLEKSYKIQAQLVKLCFPIFFQIPFHY